ncbi:MAG: DUF4398 domain-containing protein [Pseudomonas gingeri]
MSIRPLFAALAVLALAGCATDPAPNEQMRLTGRAIAQAHAVGANANDVPELKMAEDKFRRAKANMLEDAFRGARRKSEQAELDARLAEAKVLTEKSQEQVTLLNTRITRLNKQLEAAQ